MSPGSPDPGGDPFTGFDLETAIVRRAAECEVELSTAAVVELAAHARAVLRDNRRLGLTAIVDPPTFVARHVGEALEGAAMLEHGIDGTLLDVGSGNGYPGLPVAAARPLLEPLLAEASSRKARFLRGVLNDHFRRGAVLERHVDRAGDLEEAGAIRVIVSRAMGGWERVLPRLVPCLAGGGEILLWAGEEAGTVLRRAAWRRLRLQSRRPLPGRERSWVWQLVRA